VGSLLAPIAAPRAAPAGPSPGAWSASSSPGAISPGAVPTSPSPRVRSPSLTPAMTTTGSGERKEACSPGSMMRSSQPLLEMSDKGKEGSTSPLPPPLSWSSTSPSSEAKKSLPRPQLTCSLPPSQRLEEWAPCHYEGWVREHG
jgi:hypothetical protein